MPQYFSPGVYVEEVDSGPRPIQGVSTSVTGAVGVTRRGPTRGKPVLVTSFNEFTRTFGGYVPEPTEKAITAAWSDPDADGGYWWRFAHSVKGYFDNGGQQLFVKRVFSTPVKDQAGVHVQGAKASSATLGVGLVSEIEKDAKKKSNVFSVRHLIGLAIGTQVRVINGKTKLPLAEDGGVGATVFTIAKIARDSRSIEINVPLKEAVLASRGDYLEVSPIVAGNSATFTAKDLGTGGDSLSVRVRPMVGSSLAIQADDAVDPNPISVPLTAVAAAPAVGAPSTIQLAGPTQLANDDVVIILGRQHVLSNLTVDPAGNVTFDVAPGVPQGKTWDVGTIVRKVRRANTPNVSTSFRFAGAGRLYENALVELDNGVSTEVAIVGSVPPGAGTATFAAPPQNQYREGDTCRIVEAEVTVRSSPGGVFEAEEVFGNLRLTNGDEDPLELGAFVTKRSAFVDATLTNSVSTLSNFPVGLEPFQWQPFRGGDDDFANLTVDAFVGVDGGSGNRTGIQAFEDIEDISIVLAPNMWSPVIQSAAITHCEQMRYRVAILDPPPKASIEKIQTFREPLDTKYAALYYPWLKVRDPILAADVDVASSAHVAGIYARVDTERGVHKAPANEVIRGITGLEQDITKREQDVLNPKNINCHRFFAGRGFRVWGARTVTSDSNFRYINVRRIFNFIERSIDVGTQFVVFEPNDETLWARVRQTIGNFLNTQWRSGMLEGKTAEEAYFVACDRGATMTQDDIENGRLICEIGIAPVYPAEFVIFRIQKFTADSKLA